MVSVSLFHACIVDSRLTPVTEDVDTVRKFHEAALAAGAKDNGRPGRRPQYHPGSYGAFVIYLCGNNIDVVVHKCPETVKDG